MANKVSIASISFISKIVVLAAAAIAVVDGV
jgi:hypothetical protein